MTKKEGGLFVNKREKGNKQKQEKVYEKKKCTHKRSLSLLFFPALSVLIKSNAANNEDNKERWTQKDEKLGACKMCMRREAEINKSSVCTRNANQC